MKVRTILLVRPDASSSSTTDRFTPLRPVFFFSTVHTYEGAHFTYVSRLLLRRFSRSPLRLRHFQHTAWCIERNRIVLRLQLATLFQRSLPRFFLLILIYSFFPFLSFMFYLYMPLCISYLRAILHFFLVFLSFYFSHLNVDK